MAEKTIHILRYGTVAEKVHLEKAISAYDYLSINGNTAAYVSTAIAKFIVDKFFSKQDKGFFIDPITYAFQNEIHLLKRKSKTTGEVKIKKSIDKLIDIYGFPATKTRDNIAVTTSDFVSNDVAEDFCKRVLGFQYSLVHDHIEKNDLGKYLDYITDEQFSDFSQLRPKFLIAPYFYLDSQNPDFEKWMDLNCRLIEISLKQSKSNFSNIDVFSQIVISKNILKEKATIEKLASAYSNTKCKGITLWIDDLNEHEATIDELNGFVELTRCLPDIPIYNMYGGYFSILLTSRSKGLLHGVSHGLEYGESRKVYPVGGGIPVSKYYYLPLHQRLDFTKAFYLLEYIGAIDTTLDNWGTSERYYAEICQCAQCKEIIKKQMINFVEFESRGFYEIKTKKQTLRRKKASSETKENCLYHYLLCKKIEFLKVHKLPLDTLLDDLRIQKEIYSKCDAVQNNDLNYIDIWLSVLKN